VLCLKRRDYPAAFFMRHLRYQARHAFFCNKQLFQAAGYKIMHR